MKYIDLHCDALTKEGVAVVTAENLKKGGCALQCFAAFVDGSRGEGFSRALGLCETFGKACEREGLRPVRRAADLAEGNALLTVEGGEAVGESLENLGALHARGVRMLGLTWNADNALGAANGKVGGLTPFGRACVEEMSALGMVADVSHGSDGLVRDVAAICFGRGVPFAASHSNARAVFSHPRNLADGELRLIADCGGVVGLTLVPHFLSADGSAAGQREAFLAHARHLIAVCGEDVPALGTDFDGAPENAYVGSPAAMPKLISDLEAAFGGRVAEKIAYGNAARLFRAVLK